VGINPLNHAKNIDQFDKFNFEGIKDNKL